LKPMSICIEKIIRERERERERETRGELLWLTSDHGLITNKKMQPPRIHEADVCLERKTAQKRGPAIREGSHGWFRLLV
jgi:hypothetical protein